MTTCNNYADFLIRKISEKIQEQNWHDANLLTEMFFDQYQKDLKWYAGNHFRACSSLEDTLFNLMPKSEKVPEFYRNIRAEFNDLTFNVCA